MTRRKITWENVDEVIEDMKNRTKGDYITQGVSFNKNCERQLNLLRKALISSHSFSSFAKELIAIHTHATQEDFQPKHSQATKQHDNFLSGNEEVKEAKPEKGIQLNGWI